jgi:hypothetical protein
VNSFRSDHGQFTVTVDHWMGRGLTLIRNLHLTYEEARELVVVYRALGYADERLHIASANSTTDVAA